MSVPYNHHALSSYVNPFKLVKQFVSQNQRIKIFITIMFENDAIQSGHFSKNL